MKERRKLQYKQKKKIFFTIIICIVFILVLIFPKVKTIILKNIYPIKYEEYVYKYAEEYNVDPLLVFAIIKAESNFNPNVVSQSEAIGLMQLLESTAEETGRKLKLDSYKREDLYNPETNINIGTKYFATLYEKYKNITVALTAYNAGSGNVDKWIETGVIKEDGSDAENIPFKETNNYVRKILRDYEIYKQLINK